MWLADSINRNLNRKCIRRPAAGCAAGQDKPGVAHGEADLAALHLAAVDGADGEIQHISQDCRLQAGSVGIN